MQRHTILKAVIFFVIGLYSAYSNAVSVEVNGQSIVGGIVDSYNAVGVDSASGTATDADGESLANSAALATGQMAATATFDGAGGNQASVTAESIWSEQFIGTAGSSAQFDFFIPQATIGFAANNVRGLSGSYSVDILFNDVSIFSSSASLNTLDGFPTTAADIDLVQSGTALSSAFSSTIQSVISGGLGFSLAGYEFGPFTGSLDLEMLDGLNTLEYSMLVDVSGLIGETTAIASIGDPLNLSQQLGVTLDTNAGAVPAVPVPAAVWLFASALIGLAGFVKRGKAS